MKHTFLSFNPDHCTLDSTRIDIWQYPLKTLFPNAESLLNADELVRANRYHFERHRRRFIIARATLRLILSRYTNIPAQEILFGENEYGKPTLLNQPALQFNLSHSAELALLAIGQDHPLGIDLEFFADRPFEGIGSHMFSPVENQALQSAPSALKPLAFFHIWAQKEALIKACGMGLSYPTKEFDVPALPSTNQTVLDTKHKKTWQMVSFHPQVSCCAALCYNSNIKNIRYHCL